MTRLTLTFNGRSRRGLIDDELSPALVSQLGGLAQTLGTHPQQPKVIALVSAGRREGTTSCVVNLGRYLTRRCAKVLLVDVNTHEPALHALTGVEQAGGVQEVLSGQLTADKAAKPTTLSGLFVITSGLPCEDDDPRRDQLVPAALREKVLSSACDYNYVLLDCPAVNVYEGSASLASQCDAVILVVEGGRTLRQSAKAAKQLLLRTQCNILGVFINKRRFYIPQFLYDRL
jgi:Mrp family chromosome partitioning ATPase